MEKQGVPSRGQRICSRQRQAEIQKKRQSFILWKENVAQSEIYRRTSTSYRPREKEKSRYEIRAEALAIEKRIRASTIKGT